MPTCLLIVYLTKDMVLLLLSTITNTIHLHPVFALRIIFIHDTYALRLRNDTSMQMYRCQYFYTIPPGGGSRGKLNVN